MLRLIELDQNWTELAAWNVEFARRHIGLDRIGLD